ncbi:tyrosine-protein phosphatase [Flexivirga sp. B27]
MTSSHVPVWHGSRNLRELGGHRLVGGGLTKRNVVFRSGAPEWLTGDGWRAARADGLRKVVDLRNAEERGRRSDHPSVDDSAYEGIEFAHVPTEDPNDPVFLAECGQWLDHPRSWSPNIALYPGKFAAVFSAIASSPGPVLIHCAGGRDRTGMVCAMLLSLAGAEPESICADYEAGFRGAAEHRGHGMVYDTAAGQWTTAVNEKWTAEELDESLADRLPALRAWVDGTDVRSYLIEAGLAQRDLDVLTGLLR